jgi:hypothetical protein
LRQHRHTPQQPQHTNQAPPTIVPSKPQIPRDGRWQMERIDTEPITAADYTHAVAILAILINQWRLEHEMQNEACKNAA